jgi:hypothetical protein
MQMPLQLSELRATEILLTPEYSELLTRRPKINVEYEQLFHPIQVLRQIIGSYIEVWSVDKR